MPELIAIPGAISTVLWFLLLGLKGFALGDAVYRPEEAYQAADKQTKKFWLLILGLSMLIHLLPPFANPLDFLNLASTIAACVYVVGVRPAVKGVGGGRGNKRGSAEGPYGPW